MKEKADDKRAQIIRAALKLIAANGFHGSPTSLIARNAGVGTGTIYRYFKTKDDLIEAVYAEVRKEMDANVFSMDSEKLPIRDRFIRLFGALMRYLLKNPDVFRFFEQYQNSPYGIDKKRGKSVSGDNPFDNLLNSGKARQVIKKLENDVLFAIGFGPIICLVKDHLNGFITLNETIMETVVSMCWDGLKR